MIKEKLSLTKTILQENPETRNDGHGKFLNKVVEVLYNGEKVDFESFTPESWTRARRKIMELFPELDNRTSRTKDCEDQVKKEMA